MKLVALESPFAARAPFTVDDHVRYARLAMADCLRRGEAPIASHLLYPQVLDDLQPEQRALGIEAGLAWSVKADYAVFYCDLRWSGGMCRALERYRDHVDYEIRNLFDQGTRLGLLRGHIVLSQLEGYKP